MSYLVEQPPYCDLLRLSLSTRRFVRTGRTRSSEEEAAAAAWCVGRIEKGWVSIF